MSPCLQGGHILEVDCPRGCPDSHHRRDDGLIVVITRPISCSHRQVRGQLPGVSVHTLSLTCMHARMPDASAILGGHV